MKHRITQQINYKKYKTQRNMTRSTEIDTIAQAKQFSLKQNSLVWETRAQWVLHLKGGKMSPVGNQPTSMIPTHQQTNRQCSRSLVCARKKLRSQCAINCTTQRTTSTTRIIESHSKHVKDSFQNTLMLRKVIL